MFEGNIAKSKTSSGSKAIYTKIKWQYFENKEFLARLYSWVVSKWEICDTHATFNPPTKIQPATPTRMCWEMCERGGRFPESTVLPLVGFSSGFNELNSYSLKCITHQLIKLWKFIVLMQSEEIKVVVIGERKILMWTCLSWYYSWI